MNGDLVAYCKAQDFYFYLPLGQLFLLHVTK
jgi:hypothetical protein